MTHVWSEFTHPVPLQVLSHAFFSGNLGPGVRTPGLIMPRLMANVTRSIVAAAAKKGRPTAREQAVVGST